MTEVRITVHQIATGFIASGYDDVGKIVECFDKDRKEVVRRAKDNAKMILGHVDVFRMQDGR